MINPPRDSFVACAYCDARMVSIPADWKFDRVGRLACKGCQKTAKNFVPSARYERAKRGDRR